MLSEKQTIHIQEVLKDEDQIKGMSIQISEILGGILNEIQI